MVRIQLDERQWLKIAAVLSAMTGAGRPGNDDRNFIEAVLWWRRTGVPWRDLPGEFGFWKTVFNRFDRWARGKWERIFHALQTDIDDEWYSLDATIHRAHPHAAGGKGGPKRTLWVARKADVLRRFTSSSMRSGCRSPSNEPSDNGTIAKVLYRLSQR